MKQCISLLLALVCLFSLAACGGNKDATKESDETAQMTEEEKKLDKMAKSLGYDTIEEREDAGRMFRYGTKDVEDKDVQKEVKSVFSDCTLEISDELDDAFEVSSHGLTVRANADDAKAFVSDCEVLFAAFFQKDMFKDFDSLYVEHKNATAVSGLHANKDSSGKFSTLCTDTTTDKTLEKAYNSSRFFSTKDMTKSFSDEMDAMSANDLEFTYAQFTEIFDSGTDYFKLTAFQAATSSKEDGMTRYQRKSVDNIALDVFVAPTSNKVKKIIMNQVTTDGSNVELKLFSDYLTCLIVMFGSKNGEQFDVNRILEAIDLSSGLCTFDVDSANFSILYVGSGISCTVTPKEG